MASETITRNDLAAILNTVLSTPQAIYISTSAPTSADGEDGDVWLVYEIPSQA